MSAPAPPPVAGARVQAELRRESLRRTGLGPAPDEGLDRFAAMVRSVLRVPLAVVSLVADDRLIFPGASGLDEPWQSRRQMPVSHSLCRHVVATEKPLVVIDARTDEQVRGSPAIDDPGVVGYAGMPLTDDGGTVLGSLCAIDEVPRYWTGAELSVLAGLAASCSDSLRARIANHRAEDAVRRTELLLSASRTLADADTVGKVVDAVRDLVTGSIDPAYVGVALDDHDGYRPAGALNPAALAAWPDRTVLLPDLAAVGLRAPAALATFEEMGWQSAASVPLRGTHGWLGTLTFVWNQPNPLDQAEQSILAALGGFVAQALSRAHVLADRRAAAAVLQKALLSPLPRHENVRIAARYLPAHHEDHVGGDWYDAISLDPDRLALIIGDVTGHSVTAAAAMSQYRSMLRTLVIDRQEPPSAVLRRLEHTGRAAGTKNLATVLLAYLDPGPAGGHQLTWANAGHPAPILVLRDGHVSALGTHDPLIGALRHTSRRNQTLYLPPGAILVLHTDGLVESRSVSLDESLAEVHRLVAADHWAGPGALADRLLRHAETTTGEDDVALLIVATPGPPVPE
ncbi:GAF domain-containing SpoIIE family protein phosphatase [Actinoplanes sp. CA-030573]|uniref:GAF domain-containing SpoIIE family protein phosphatase n=1 Tax=Actinoplanes sp. CA-030573 TaxID=3239898 RepID=UPI003D8B5DC4